MITRHEHILYLLMPRNRYKSTSRAFSRSNEVWLYSCRGQMVFTDNAKKAVSLSLSPADGNDTTDVNTHITCLFTHNTENINTPPPTIPQYKVCNRNTYGPQCMNVPPPQSQTCRLVHGTAPTNSTFRCFPALPLGFKVHRMSIQSVCMYGPKGSCTESKDFEKVYEIDFCRLVSELVAAC